jgi:SAM-dependent methyltransferase
VKFGPEAARGWSEDAYADPQNYLSHRAKLVRTLGPPLEPGDRVLDLACGDGGLAEFLLPHGLAYIGVDASHDMVEAAQERLGDRAAVEVGTIDEYRPSAGVAATTVFRAIYYASDRRAFFRHAVGFTEKKLVFDLNPRQYRLDVVRAELADAGFDGLEVRPFFVPQTAALPRPALRLLIASERVRPLAKALLRVRFTYVCAAFRSGRESSSER